MASKLYFILSMGWLLCVGSIFAQNTATSSSWIIANNSGQTTLSTSEFERVFIGERALWKNGKQVIIVMHTNKTAEAQLTANRFFDGNVGRMQKYWLGMVFQGRVKPPVFLDSHAAIVAYVTQHEGAIALVYDADFPKHLEIRVQ